MIGLMVCTLAIPAEDPSVLADLRQLSSNRGWGLAKLGPLRALILTLDSDPVHSREATGTFAFHWAASSASGNCVSFMVPEDSMASSAGLPDETIFTVKSDGVIRKLKGRFPVIKGLAVSSDCTRVAVDGVYVRREPKGGTFHSEGAGLWYGLAGGEEDIKLIAHSTEPEPHITDPLEVGIFHASWSPDNKRVAYVQNGTVLVHDLERGTSVPLVKGKLPVWSPDGRWIGYQSGTGDPMLLRIETETAEPLLLGMKCLCSMQWSPDSQYVLFTRQGKTGDTVFMVCRIQDRAVAPLYFSRAEFCSRSFAWITTDLINILTKPISQR